MWIYLFYIFSIISKAIAIEDKLATCDLSQVGHLIKNINYDTESLELCNDLKKQIISNCNDNGNAIEQQKKIELLNELYYKEGLIELSLGHELKALDNFKLTIESDSKDAYVELAKNRISKLYRSFGLWNENNTDNSDDHEIYNRLIQIIDVKWNSNKDDRTIDNDFNELFKISPYDIKMRKKFIDVLLYRLSKSIDISDAYYLTKCYQILIDKHSTSVTLEERLNWYYAISTVQVILLGIDSVYLRKCLAIDMDYQPCKTLSILQSKLKKINPPKSDILSSDMYKSSDGNSIDWNTVVDFYLQSKRPCLKKMGDQPFINNYKLISELVESSINRLLNGGSSILHVSDPSNAELIKYIDVLLCQASIESPSAKSLTSSYCKKALKEVLTNEQWDYFYKSLTKGETFPIDELRNIWNSYPHLGTYLIASLLKKGRKTPENIQDEINKFFNDNGVRDASNPYIKKQIETIDKLLEKKNAKFREQQQQQQQQEWFFNQQQFNQHQHQRQQQHHAPPPPPQDHTGKDYYKVLGISKAASSKEIRKAYLDLTKKYHPDKQGQLSEKEQEKIHEKMSQVNEAYEILSDEGKKRDYDNSRGGGHGGPGGHGGGGGGGFGNFGNMFRGRDHGNPFQFGKNVKVKFGGFGR
ncbi:hypothetical protein Kpol_1027p13 [Vanderwaltozyma polyspora DSM 70294]|uniref:J domain-containing protein n=1 Tax=Vanderwaltozyma polyspora (strain ATCC 22028 / DSM 70294 / BCRC 21397 / CBS 2163 / NBRC 10782 / NRRL Y-8283 / UCD 57-17) TaxID=436907 RepID=A7TQL8_VANPO|nr:uncharacterized protein Kpol_1027p13 [Vanderwaltozyma polyspora DSM 70294]EDO15439.1 hypothetical protein Kpol_1027p13 [Vanderwaltozyma polyspora DSM 70294]